VLNSNWNSVSISSRVTKVGVPLEKKSAICNFFLSMKDLKVIWECCCWFNHCKCLLGRIILFEFITPIAILYDCHSEWQLMFVFDVWYKAFHLHWLGTFFSFMKWLPFYETKISERLHKSNKSNIIYNNPKSKFICSFGFKG